MQVKKNTEGLKIEPGMILVYTPSSRLSAKAEDGSYKLLKQEVCKALSIDSDAPLPVGIIITMPGDKLELLKAREENR